MGHKTKIASKLLVLTLIVVAMNACSDAFAPSTSLKSAVNAQSGTGTGTSTSSGSAGGSSGSVVVVAPPMTSATPLPPANNAKIVFSDDFNTLELFNSVTGKGTWAPCGLYGKTVQGMTGWGDEYDIDPTTNTLGINPFKIKDGVLSIVTEVIPQNLISQLNDKHFSTGALRTWNVPLGYGYYEMRAQMPVGDGNWSAFWLLPADGGWPPEIDILEFLGNSKSTSFTTVHTTIAIPDYGQKFADNHYSRGDADDTGVDLTQGYHLYGCDFEDDMITFYFDGVKKFSMPTPPDLKNRAVYITINNEIGGWNNNVPDAKSPVWPSSYNIDYVKVYDTRPF